jgi:hypothetical protein
VISRGTVYIRGHQIVIIGEAEGGRGELVGPLDPGAVGRGTVGFNITEPGEAGDEGDRGIGAIFGWSRNRGGEGPV